MNKNVIIFAGGILTGAAACFAALFAAGADRRHIIFREKKKPAEEISEKHDGLTIVVPMDDDLKEFIKKNPVEYSTDIGKIDYSSYSKIAADYSSSELEETPAETKPKPSVCIYPITADEFNENGEYAAVSLTLYSDGVVADDSLHVIDDVHELLGEDWDEEKNEDDEIFIRNDYLMEDFDIVRDLRSFEEATKDKPWMTQDKEDYD